MALAAELPLRLRVDIPRENMRISHDVNYRPNLRGIYILDRFFSGQEHNGHPDLLPKYFIRRRRGERQNDIVDPATDTRYWSA